jgi:hypothetical protein
MKYGNSIETVKHVAKIGGAFWLVLFAIFAITAYATNKLTEPESIIILFVAPLIVASVVPFVVWITTLLVVVVEDGKISLLAFYKLKYNPQPIEQITSINIGRGLFSIHFEDGSSIRTLGMYIGEYSRLIGDIKVIRKRPLKIKSDWLQI